MPPFLGIEHKFLATSFTFLSGDPAVTESVGIVIPFISVLVRTVKALIVFAIVSF